MATVADSAEENFSLRQRTKTHYDRKISLTPTGLLMEGHFTQNLGPNTVLAYPLLLYKTR